MGANPIVKEMIKAKLTHTSDGLLFDFCSREQWKAAWQSCCESIDRREREIEFLDKLSDTLKELGESNVPENNESDFQQQE